MTSPSTPTKRNMDSDSSQASSSKRAKGSSRHIQHQAEDPEAGDNGEDKSCSFGEGKWTTLEHNGPLFPPPYQPLPKNVKLIYAGKTMKLAPEAEEAACLYSLIIRHVLSTNKTFNNNFFNDWKKKIKEHDLERVGYYGFCTIDGQKEKIANFRVKAPGLFRGRGNNPKIGKLKRRIEPEDIIINCTSLDAAPQPPIGHEWKEVCTNKKVAWLACWRDNGTGPRKKYIVLHPSSQLRSGQDREKFDFARTLSEYIGRVREKYTADLKTDSNVKNYLRIRQYAVALYFIDRLSLRLGKEKEERETAETVGCCSLRKKHIKLHRKNHRISFDFLGKDSIPYQKETSVDEQVFKNLKLFMKKKDPEAEIFDQLDTRYLNRHLGETMEGLSAKVFRTYHANKTFQEQLENLTKNTDKVHQKVRAYNRANRAVAILCNHQRSTPAAFKTLMANATAKIHSAQQKVEGCQAAVDAVKTGSASQLLKQQANLNRAKEFLNKLKLGATDREENKTVALETSKDNYLDPRISVAWCKNNQVPIERIFNKAQRERFRWAIETTDEDFVF